MLHVDCCVVWNNLWEHPIYCGPGSESFVKLVWNDYRADLIALTAAGAGRCIHISGLSFNGDNEVAYKSLHFFQLVVGEEVDVFMLAHIAHHRALDADRAVQCGEGLVKLGHDAADRGLTLYKMHLETQVR
ncbi:hypothetical protein BMS3Bbin16_01221 [archaeon BMS3Bbin16]|nr:hypothetical protein BMS3Bbin16_01221 [archaeon BMS3Bbin16]